MASLQWVGCYRVMVGVLGHERGGGGSGRSLGKTAKISAPAGLSTGLLCAADG